MGDIVQADLVKETTATQGVGAYSLAGADDPFQTFVDGIGDGKSCFYGVTNSNDREITFGTVTAGSPDTLSRDKVLQSSNGGAAVNWGAGNKDVRLIFPADVVGGLVQDARSITAGATLTIKGNGVLLMADASGGAFTQNLPAGADIVKGYTVLVVKTDTSANAVTLDGASAETINGATTFKLTQRFQAVVLAWDGTEWKIVFRTPHLAMNAIQNLALSASVATNALTLAIKTHSGDDPTTANPVIAPLRSSTLGSGSYNVRNIAAALSLTISSGSTLGHKDATPGYIYWYLIDNSGTLELAASTRFFGLQGIVSTSAEGGAGAADSATVMYSASARANVPFICIGRTTDTQTTAGTWAAAPSAVELAPFHDGDSQDEAIIDVSASDVDCSLGNSFSKTVNGATTFTFSNAPSGRAYGFTLLIDHVSGAITWPASVEWPGDTAPTLATGKKHLGMFETRDGGSTWRGAMLVDYAA